MVIVAIAARYKGYRYPIEVIGHAVWLYHRFALSLRDVEELMYARGLVVTSEAIRSWCAKFGPDYAARLCRWRPRPGDKWHFDEVFVKINGTTHYLWRGRSSRRQRAWRLPLSARGIYRGTQPSVWPTMIRSENLADQRVGHNAADAWRRSSVGLHQVWADGRPGAAVGQGGTRQR